MVSKVTAVKSGFFGVLFEYDTPRIVHIRSKKVGAINRLLQLCIIGYVIGYAIIFKKGYQEFDDVQGAVTTKLKGVARTENLFSNHSGERIWDVADYVVPPQENNAFFVITNLIITDGQHLDVCEENADVPGANCTEDKDICVANQPLLAGDGYMTGNCNPSTRYPGSKSCEVFAWCPTEDGTRKPPDPPAIAIAENFTVFIKNNIEFPKFGTKRRNIPNMPEDVLKSCRYDPNTDNQCPVFQLKTVVLGTGTPTFNDIAIKWHYIFRRNILGYSDDDELRNCRFTKDHPHGQFCPIFVLGDIVSYTGYNFGELTVKGGVVQIIINWDCNLDHGEDDCLPEYSFRRLDSKADVLSPGYNFRFARFYKDENGNETRTLFKAYGIKFILTLQGKAGKFSVVPLLLNIGSGLAILSIASLICDFIVLYVLKARTLYREKKYLQVVGDDAYKDLPCGGDGGDQFNFKQMEGEESDEEGEINRSTGSTNSTKRYQSTT